MGAPSVERLASSLSAMLPRCNNAAWPDPGCEAVDSLHLSDASWRVENDYSNPPPPPLPPRAGGSCGPRAEASAERSRSHRRGAPMGGQGVALTKMAVAERMVPPSPELFKPGRRAGRGILGAPRWSVNIFQELFRPGCTCAVAP